MSDEFAHLRLALHGTWDEIAPRVFHHHGTRTLRAQEVRDAVMHRLETEPLTNVNVRKFWTTLTREQRLRMLVEAFPDGPYSARVEEDQDVRDDGLLED